jgi:hypothetical protein
MCEAQVEMPKYRCHKEVWALQIKEVICHAHADPDVTIEEFSKSEYFTGGHIIPEREGYAPIPFDAEYYRKHNPQAGGYYMVYKDGYKSFSPANALEDGYTEITTYKPLGGMLVVTYGSDLINEDLDKRIIEAVEKVGYGWLDSGYDLRKNERDLRFEKK